MESTIFRFANVVGKRSTHGVIYDFINKLKENPQELEILGDGKQTKSYLSIYDCMDAMFFAVKHKNKNNAVEMYNIGSEDQTNVIRIAEIIVSEMGLDDVKFRFTGGVDGGRGWKGDIKIMQLSIEKLKKLGWAPRYNSDDAIRDAAKNLLSGEISNSFL